MKEITMWNEDVQWIVIDNVSKICKVEFTWNDISRVVFPWNVGRWRHTSIMIEIE